jgi:Mg2+/Co2+ transporter CorC
VPSVGEHLELEGLAFRVEAADERRVTSVVIHRIEVTPEAAS